MRRLRLAAVLTHPTQYFAPWFRQLHRDRSDVEFTAVYAVAPDATSQGVGFGRAFTWDVPLLDGYPHIVLKPGEAADVHSSSFLGVDAPILPTLRRLKPDAVLVCGWHSIFQLRALAACRRLGVPTIYRGDTTLLHKPEGFRGTLWAWKSRLVLQGGFHAYLAVGKRSREYLAALGVSDQRIFRSPHCVDNEFFATAAAATREAKKSYGLQDRHVALFAGKLESIKRPSDLLAALAALGGDCSALFVGAGPMEESLRRQADELGVNAAFAGFHNQSQMGRAYAAADVFVLPSQTETWGLAVNEALACGVPCVVSDGVGSAPDLIEPGCTGDVYSRGDIDGLATALRSVRGNLERGEPMGENCRKKAAEFSFPAASRGLIAAAESVARGRPDRRRAVVAACGAMAFEGGLERQTFQVLEVLQRDGRPVHVIGNDWATGERPGDPNPINALAARIGAQWHVGSYWLPFSAARRPIGFVKLFAECCRVSRELVRLVQTTHASVVFFPDYGTVLRNLLGVGWLRAKGVRTVLRIGNAPERTSSHDWMWRRLLPKFVDRFVANSEFGARRLRESGAPVEKIRCVKNCVVHRSEIGDRERAAAAAVSAKRTVLCVGQLAPFKGPHLLLDAAERLIATGRDFHVAFLGRRPDWPAEYAQYAADLESRAQSGPLKGHVQFLGEVSNVPAVMREAFLLAAPIAQEETFGNVVLEAASVGLPAVVTPRGGLIELVEHRRTGYICADATAESVAEGLEWFLSDESRRSSAARACSAAAKRGDWPYSRERYVTDWLGVFDELESSAERRGKRPMNRERLRVVG